MINWYVQIQYVHSWFVLSSSILFPKTNRFLAAAAAAAEVMSLFGELRRLAFE